MARWKSSPPAKDRTRTGTGDHAEYYTADQKVILRGSWVRMVEKLFNSPQPNTTEGKEADLLRQR